ncbi:MAG: hypothetical protein C6I00_04455 [Nitratiruptor sp.]|nr:hypothetical protein [Nitratiruptor sp.]NPA84341.1 hypothetical protein [Campylobacterota bacterium]
MYTFVVLVVVTILGVLAYYLFLRQKREKLAKIEQGICPECEGASIEIGRIKGGGCSGTTNVIYRCSQCGYEEEFNVGGSCGSGRCNM